MKIRYNMIFLLVIVFSSSCLDLSPNPIKLSSFSNEDRIFTISFLISSGGSLDINGTNYTEGLYNIEYKYGEIIDLVATPLDPDDGVIWGLDITGNENNKKIVANKNMTAMLSFGKPIVTLNVNPTFGGAIKVNGTTYKSSKMLQFYKNSTVALEGVADTPANIYNLSEPYYGLDSWSGDVSGTTPTTTLKLTKDSMVGASFVKLHTLRLNVGTAGSVSVDGANYAAGSHLITYRATHTPTIIAKNTHAVSYFDYWSKDLTGDITNTTINVVGNKVVEANFIALAPDEALYTFVVPNNVKFEITHLGGVENYNTGTHKLVVKSAETLKIVMTATSPFSLHTYSYDYDNSIFGGGGGSAYVGVTSYTVNYNAIGKNNVRFTVSTM